MKPVFLCCLLLLSGLPAWAKYDSLITNFRKADSLAALYKGHSLKDLNQLTNKLTLPLATEEEKFRAIYKWVCDNIVYDYQLNKKNQHKREILKTPEKREAWNHAITTQVLRTLYEKQRTVCTGYAYLIKKMSLQAGIDCVIVDGYGRTAQANIGGEGRPNHSWNAVKLRGKWYLCDATWSSGAWDMQLNSFAKKYNDVYFLANPALFIRNHYPLDSAWALSTRKPALSEFLNGPIIYSDAYTWQLEEISPKTFEVITKKGEPFSVSFTASPAIDSVHFLVKGPGGVSHVYPTLQRNSDGFYELKHTFKSKGLYTVHVTVKENYLMTYSVLVK